MAQKIDTSEFVDQFTDGTVRYSQTGIDRIAKNNWAFTIARYNNVYTIRVYQNGVLANFNAASTTPLSSTDTKLNVYRTPSTLVSSYPASGWTFVSTGIYTIADTSMLVEGAHVAELNAVATFTNPVVSGKTSVITDGTASYPQQSINTSWIAASAGFSINADGQASDIAPIFDGVDFALGGNISFR